MITPAEIDKYASILGLDAADLARQVRVWNEKLATADGETARAAQVAGSQRVVAEGLLTETLQTLYPPDRLRDAGLRPFFLVVEGSEISTPIVGFGSGSFGLEVGLAGTGARQQSYVLDESAPLAPPPAEVVAQILADLASRKVRFWNQPVYRLLRLETSAAGLQAELAMEEYIRYRVTAGALGDELMQALIDKNFRSDEVVACAETSLPWRRRLLPNARVVADYGARMCAGGVHVTLAIHRPEPDDDFVIPLQKRSPLLSESQGMISVLPTALHQPAISAVDGTPFYRTVYRELYEEVFGGEELTAGSPHLMEDWYMKPSVSEPLAWMADNPDGFRMMLLGFGLSLLSGNYELAVLLMITDDSFWKRFGHMLITNWETTATDSPMISTKATTEMRRLLENRAWTGGGLFSFACGLSYLARNEPSKVEIPGLLLQPA